ncbi:MAG: glycosyltransferase family 1 protein [Chitinophagaceae bacterium]|nr:glycosyltransferase family 1 protein [Chitinophagaceae bacterium]
MKIAIDIRDFRLASSGTKTYLQGLLTALKKQSSPALVILELDSIFLAASNTTPSLFHKIKLHLFTLIWKQLILPIKCWRLGADVLICTDYMLPLTPLHTKKLVVFHDALFFDYPAYYPQLWLSYFRSTALRAANQAAFIVTTSNFSKERLLHHFPAWQSKLSIIYQGPKTWSSISLISEKGSKLLNCIGTSPFFLHVGTLERRKNLPFLVRAFAKFNQHGQAKLVLIGGSSFKKKSDDHFYISQLIQELKLEKQVILGGYLSDGDLPFFYKRATAYIYPSLYEGFGIPIIEAFHHQLPVAVAKGSSLTEVAGDAALEFNPTDQRELIVVMEKLLNDKDIRRDLIQKGWTQKNKFNWDTAAHQFIELARESLILRRS